MGERKLKAWIAAGVIDSATATRIRHFEAQGTRPLALFAVLGLALLVTGLGIVSIVAENWATLPPLFRISLHGTLLVGLCLATCLLSRGGNSVRPMLLDTSLLAVCLLSLALIGHFDQLYHLSRAPWQSLTLWLLVFGPLLIWLGQGWMSALVLVSAVAGIAALRIHTAFWNGVFNEAKPDLILQALEAAAPTALAIVAKLACSISTPNRAKFWDKVATLAVCYAVVGISLLTLASGRWDWRSNDSQGMLNTATFTLATALAGISFLLWRLGRSRAVAATAPRNTHAMLIALCALSTLASYPLSGNLIASVIHFIVLCCAIAAVVVHTTNRTAHTMR